MEVDFALLADAAASPPDGKLYIHGGAFDTISSSQFPCLHAHMALVLRLLSHRSESDTSHTVTIRLMDTDGHDVIPQLSARVQPQPSPRTGRGTTYTVVAGMNNLNFERPGEYSFEILIDGRHAKSLALYLVELPSN